MMRKVAIFSILAVCAAFSFGCGDAKSADSVKIPTVESSSSNQEKSEKQKQFEAQLAKEKEEYNKKFNKVKSENEAIRQEFENNR